MNGNWNSTILAISGGITIICIGWGLMQVLLSISGTVLDAINSSYYWVLQVFVIFLAVLLSGLIGFVFIRLLLNLISGFEESVGRQIASLRRQINNLTNNLGSEVLAIVTATLVTIAQDAFTSNGLAKYSVGILSGVYLFFSIQLIKRKGRRDKLIGVFFYIFPAIIAAVYYSSKIQIINNAIAKMEIEDIVLFGAALITLLLALYYSFKAQTSEAGVANKAINSEFGK